MNLSTLLFRLGITPNYKAYHQIITAITLSSENTGLLMLVTKQLYPAVAQTGNCQALQHQLAGGGAEYPAGVGPGLAVQSGAAGGVGGPSPGRYANLLPADRHPGGVV